MRAYDSKPSVLLGSFDVKPFQPRRGASDALARSVRAEDPKPTNVRGAFTGAPKSPEGSGSGYNGLVRIGDVVTPVPTGNSVGGAAALTGGGLSISDAAQTGLDVSSTFTLEGWTNGSIDGSANKRWCILSKLDASGGYELNYNIVAGVRTLEFVVRQAAGNVGTLGPAWTTLKYEHTLWHHVAVVFNGGTVDFYIDGEGPTLKGTMTQTSAGNSAASFNLYQNSSAANPFTGTLSNMRVWSTARTQSQIITDMRNDAPSGTGLQGFWKLASDTTDYSGNGNNLTTSGTATYGTTTPFGTYGATQRFYAGTADGLVQTQGSTSWTDARDVTTGNAAKSTGTIGTVSDQHINLGNLFYVSRVSEPFNLSSGTWSGRVLIGAHLGVQPIAGTSLSSDSGLGVSASTPATAGTGIATTDFGSITGSAYSSFTTLVVSAYGFLQFTTAGVATLSITGTNNFGIRTRNDLNNTAPSGNTLNQVVTITAEGGTPVGPFLDVVTVAR